MRNMDKAESLTDSMSGTEEKTLAADVERLANLLKEFGRRRSLRDPLFTACEDLDLTPPQVHTIAWLGGEGGLTMGELSRRNGITEKTITGIVDRLEARSLVIRERDAVDRRVVRVRLTPDGSQVFSTVDRLMKGALGRVLGFLDLEDRAQLFVILSKLNARMDEAHPTTGGAGDES